VEEGKVADLVVVNGNPLEDMKVLLTSVAVVMQGGKVIRNDL
jgi:imidazolonepropionase-like amidohydrolase